MATAILSTTEAEVITGNWTPTFPTVRVPLVTHPSGFERSNDMAELADVMASEYRELADCNDAKLAYYWKIKGGGTEERPVLGKITKASGVLIFETSADYIVWLAADHLHGAPQEIIQAALYHQLRQVKIEYDKNDEPKFTLDKPIPMFASEIDRFGAWHEGIRDMGHSFRQLVLTDD